MMQERVSCLMVVDDGKLCGLVTATDFLVALQCTMQIWEVFANLSNADLNAELDGVLHGLADCNDRFDQSLTALADESVGSGAISTSRCEDLVETSQRLRELSEDLSVFGKHFRECIQPMDYLVEA